MAERIRIRLSVLDAAETLNDISLPGYALHPLTGNRTPLMGCPECRHLFRARTGATINRELTLLKAMLKKAVEWGCSKRSTRYAHLSMDYKREAVAKLPALGPQKPSPHKIPHRRKWQKSLASLSSLESIPERCWSG